MKPTTKTAVALASLFIASIALKSTDAMADFNKEKDLYNGIKSGQYTLTCQLRSGIKRINPEKLTDVTVMDGEPFYQFTNGGASRCDVE
ncbi:hypothetical protein A6A19_00795 [Actinobacillus delphinicola]|uniref:hypothetical protein n=1 Tax=Actinobacillus delphinicola TaxID=51161 RepID=UPI002442990D|nr:hypothetical protein [Actinobacillus delphinicola]MDG6896567.1 hypothetical protein [Actinobacillus delphinicola]